MTGKRKFFQLDWLVALSFFLTNLARTEWIEGVGRHILIVLILLSIAFIIGLFFTQRGFTSLSPIGILAVFVGFIPSALWYLTRFVAHLGFQDLSLALQSLYEVTNYASLAVLLVLLPYLLIKRAQG